MNEKQEYDYSKLKGRIVAEEMNNSIFAKMIGISPTTLYNIFNNKSYFKQYQIERAKEVLHLTDEEITPIFFTLKVKKNLTEI